MSGFLPSALRAACGVPARSYAPRGDSKKVTRPTLTERSEGRDEAPEWTKPGLEANQRE